MNDTRGFSVLVTNLIKLGGLGMAINEGLLRAELRPLALAVYAFMMAGAQGVETFLDRLMSDGKGAP